jgi:hypothetical protein
MRILGGEEYGNLGWWIKFGHYMFVKTACIPFLNGSLPG